MCVQCSHINQTAECFSLYIYNLNSINCTVSINVAGSRQKSKLFERKKNRDNNHKKYKQTNTIDLFLPKKRRADIFCRYFFFFILRSLFFQFWSKIWTRVSNCAFRKSDILPNILLSIYVLVVTKCAFIKKRFYSAFCFHFEQIFKKNNRKTIFYCPKVK